MNKHNVSIIQTMLQGETESKHSSDIPHTKKTTTIFGGREGLSNPPPPQTPHF